MNRSCRSGLRSHGLMKGGLFPLLKGELELFDLPGIEHSHLPRADFADYSMGSTDLPGDLTGGLHFHSEQWLAMAQYIERWVTQRGGNPSMNKTNTPALTLIGLSWAFIGMGYMSIQFHFLPKGWRWSTETLGSLPGRILERRHCCSRWPKTWRTDRPMAGGLGYLLFAPLGIMVGLLAPGAYEPVQTGSSITFAVLAPVLITISGCHGGRALALGFTGGLAMAAHRMINRD